MKKAKPKPTTVVYRYKVGNVVNEVIDLDLPDGPILYAAALYGTIQLWVQVTTTLPIGTPVPTKPRKVAIMGTGHPIPAGAKHINSFTVGLVEVYHVYEVPS